ncbi:MAG: glycoside hydrolase family 43 protein [Chitinophagaceae bacterium]
MRIKLLLCLIIITGFLQNLATAQAQTFSNPILPSGADPWCIFKNGYYYYTNTLGNRIDVWKTKSIASLPTAERKTVWKPPATGPYSKEIWAPEIHFLKGKWYIYFAADSGRNNDHRLWVLENDASDPLKGEWKVKGKLTTPGDKWSIDGSVFEYKNIMYLIWSGWEGDVNGQQNIYIAKMKNPWTVEGKRILISSPSYYWERHGDIKRGNDIEHVYVNEGPEVLVHNNTLFLVYSASGCWTDNYTLGLLKESGDDLLNPASWIKYPEPVFTQSIQNKVFAPGHNCFFKSPDGKEDWILYHANSEPSQGCGRFRSPRAQKFSWTEEGLPNFGEPVAEKIPVVIPSEVSSTP